MPIQFFLIDENEVTAGHAASVGRVDPEEMYYLMSRGLRKENGTFGDSWLPRFCHYSNSS